MSFDSLFGEPARNYSTYKPVDSCQQYRDVQLNQRRRSMLRYNRMAPNISLILAAYPTGLPIPGEHLKLQGAEIDTTVLPEDKSLLLKTNYISYDPYQRGRMRDPKVSSSYIASYTLGSPINNNAISTVVLSSIERFKPGDVIVGNTDFSHYVLVDKEKAMKSLDQGGFDTLENPQDLDPKLFLGALGMSGLTAYSSLYEIGRPKFNEVIFISAASGAVGQIVGQLAKREGMIVIGSVGTDVKLDFIIDQLKFDGGFNYKKDSPAEGLKNSLKKLGLEGVDVYYDNVGGETLDAALGAMKTGGRIISCGSISQTSLPPSEQYGIKNMGLVVSKRLRIRGFIVSDPDMGPKYKEEWMKNMSQWIKNEEITVKMNVTKGIERSADGFVGMLEGRNFGKAVLTVSEI
ncbi:hypothetical protein NHQ30_010860 [Ciborinia camelliae]|nr:hypothetical protein NHQ30_010860 [Ciborinia camelliae]